jgi:hypothetical protein
LVERKDLAFSCSNRLQESIQFLFCFKKNIGHEARDCRKNKKKDSENFENPK